MANTQDVVLVAGTVVEHQLTDGSWKRVPKLTAIGAVGEQDSPKEKTTIEDRVKKYGSGMRDAPDKNLKGQTIPVQQSGDTHYDDYLLQQEFITRCRNREEFNMRVVWPDGEVNGFLFKALGFQYDESTQEDWKMFSVNGKQNSLTVFSVAFGAGGTTVSVGGSVQLTLSTTPAMTAAEMGSVKWTSSAISKATVSASGLVTGVAAGTTTITADVRGVTVSKTITVS